jgi:sporulation protein YlmC with PRC-barrel domain
MGTTHRAAITSCALLLGLSPPASVSAQSNIRERVTSAVEAVEAACAADIDKFCGNVTRGEGRVIVCMQAHDDKLSLRCQFALYRVSRGLDRALNRVERIADACWSDIEAHCQGAESIAQCVMDRGPTLSPACKTVVAGLRQAVQGLASLKGMPVFSADGKNLGDVVNVVRGPDGKLQSVQIEVGRFLGIGDRTVSIDASQFEQLVDRIKLRLDANAIRSLPEAGKQ